MEFKYQDGKISSVVKYKESEPENKIIDQYTTSIYNGNVLKKIRTNPLGYTSEFILNPNGDLIQVTDELGQIYNYGISPEGNLLTAQSTFGGEYNYFDEDVFLSCTAENNFGTLSYKKQTEYFPDGRIKTQTDGKGNQVIWNYDNSGKTTALTTEQGSLFFSYDDFGRVCSEITGHSNSKEFSESFTEYEYSEDGKILKINYGDEIYETAFLDSHGRLIKLVDGEGNEIEIHYDFLGNIS